MTRRSWVMTLLATTLMLALVFPAGSAPAKGDTVTVRAISAKVMKKARFLGKPVVTVSRGELLTFAKKKGDWYQVKTSAGKKGWIHRGAVVDKELRLSSKPGRSGSGASQDEVELAGRGFTPEVEKSYRSKHRDLDFSHVDAIEKSSADPAAAARFAKKGKIGGGR